MNKLSSLVLAVVLTAPAGAQAGTVYTMLEQVGPAKKILLSVQDQSLRMDEQSDNSVVFNGRAGQAIVIDHGEKAYMLVDRARIAETMDQINPALEQMRKQLANMPPEQRAMVEKMMGGRMPTDTSPPAQSAVRRTGEAGEHGGVDCEWYTVTREGVVQQKMCLADPDDIPGGRQALETMRQMAQFFEEAFASIRAQLPFGLAENPMSNLERMDGFPIITQRLSNGSVTSDLRLDDATAADIDGGLFAAPSNYSERRLGDR